MRSAEMIGSMSKEEVFEALKLGLMYLHNEDELPINPHRWDLDAIYKIGKLLQDESR